MIIVVSFGGIIIGVTTLLVFWELGLPSYQVVLPFHDIYKIDSSYPGQTVRNIDNVHVCHNSHFECRNIRLSWYISNSTG